VRSTAVEEVEAILDFLDRDGIFLCTVLNDKLLEEQERSLMRDLLSDLDESFPGVFSGEPRAIGALPMLDKVLDLESLLEDGIRKDLCQLHVSTVSPEGGRY
jgi:hypothetical protein